MRYYKYTVSTSTKGNEMQRTRQISPVGKGGCQRGTLTQTSCPNLATETYAPKFLKKPLTLCPECLRFLESKLGK
jgi:hypothetical protein